MPSPIYIPPSSDCAAPSSGGNGRRRRFTLVEVLLAVSVLAVGMVGVLAAYAKSADTLRITKENVDAYHLLKQTVAEARLDALRPGPIAYGQREGQFDPPYSNFAWRLEIRPGPEDDEVAEVEGVVVNQINGRSYSLTTYIRKRQIRGN